MTQAKGMSIPISERLDMETSECSPVVYYPQIYTEENWGMNHMNTAYLATDANGCHLYSYPIMREVLRYSRDFSNCDTLRMQSRYDTGIQPSPFSEKELEGDDLKDDEYYASQLTYGEILYDKYRDLYIRQVGHPKKAWNVSDTRPKKVSFILADAEGKVLSETSIAGDTPVLLGYNMFVCKQGLAIATSQADEQNIYFNIYEISGKQ